MSANATGSLRFAARTRLGAFELDVAFDVHAGERVALVGPNGAGKSTCLEIIAGLRNAGVARVALGNDVLTDTGAGIDLAPARRRLGLLFQRDTLFPHMTVEQNVAYGLRARGGRDAEARAATGRWIPVFDLEALASRPIETLSGGQRQRVALARAMASGARALLLDEPFAALDLATRSTVRGELRRHLDAIDVPTLFVTHDPLDARVFGDRIIVLEAGRVVQAGDWETIAHAPRSALAAELAGLNLVSATLEPGIGLRRAVSGNTALQVLADGVQGDTWLAFSPGEVVLSVARPTGSAQNVFEARVVEVLPAGDRLRVRLDAGIPMTAEITPSAEAALGVATGRTIWASVKATAIRVYR